MSSTPVTVTVWPLFQLATENVKVDEEGVPSPSSLLEMDTVRLKYGCASKTTLKSFVVPVSLTPLPLVGLILKVAVFSETKNI
jgi:hypothetical protein